MAKTTRPPALRIDVPTLEPDAAMVARLAVASTASTPSPGASWLVGLRTALVAVVVAVLGATSWAAGALAGVDTPFRHRVIQHAPLVPVAPTGSTGSPQSGGSTSGSPAPPGLPHDTASIAPAKHRATERVDAPRRKHARPAARHAAAATSAAGDRRKHHGRHHGKHHGKLRGHGHGLPRLD